MNAALFGYLSPAIAMLLGAGLGSVFAGSDSATAIGAIAGFLGALVIARCAISIIPVSNQINVSQQEFHHER
jgi:sigma-E factor negative regulatory protein RseC